MRAGMGRKTEGSESYRAELRVKTVVAQGRRVFCGRCVAGTRGRTDAGGGGKGGCVEGNGTAWEVVEFKGGLRRPGLADHAV